MLELAYAEDEETTDDARDCTCGSTLSRRGFFSYDEEGNEVEALVGPDRDELLICRGCFRVIDAYSPEVADRQVAASYLG